MDFPLTVASLAKTGGYTERTSSDEPGDPSLFPQEELGPSDVQAAVAPDVASLRMDWKPCPSLA